MVQAAIISHSHPEGVPVNLAAQYGLPSNLKEGVPSMVGLRPVNIPYHRLFKLVPPKTPVDPVIGDNLQNLLRDTGMFYPL